MGFTLSISRASTQLDEDSEKRLIKLLNEQESDVNWEIAVDEPVRNFPFELTSMGNDPILVHWEVDWSWWQCLVDQMTLTLGPKNVTFTNHMQALFGAALPFNIQNRHLIEFEPKKWKWHQRLLICLIAKSGKISLTDDVMVCNGDDPKAIRNLRIGSIPKILAEVELACQKWGLPDDEQSSRRLAEDMFSDLPETDEAISRCYGLMVRTFLRYASTHNHVVWFIK